jgi:Lysyl oxidase
MGANLVPIVRRFSIHNELFEEDSGSIADGCVTLGWHRVMRFDFLSHNIGDAELVVGNPEDHLDWFVWSPAHQHWHLKDFNQFVLLDVAGDQVTLGYKQAFCLVDVEHTSAWGPDSPKFVNCLQNQGVSAGWADLYDKSLACQFIVIDGVRDGDYVLASTTNAQRIFPEDTFEDNTILTGLRIRRNSVTEINLPILIHRGARRVFGRDWARNTKSIYAVTTDGRLTETYDAEGWHLNFPAEDAGSANLRFQGTPAVFGRDLALNTKSIYVVTTDGRLAQVYDGAGWNLDFPAEAAGQATLRFQGSPAVFGRNPVSNTKSIYALTTDGRLTQVYDGGGWHLDFPAEAAGQATLRFEGSPAVFGRDPMRNTKSIYAMTNEGRLAQVYDGAGWHLDFPAEAAGQATLRFQSRI